MSLVLKYDYIYLLVNRFAGIQVIDRNAIKRKFRDYLESLSQSMRGKLPSEALIEMRDLAKNQPTVKVYPAWGTIELAIPDNVGDALLTLAGAASMRRIGEVLLFVPVIPGDTVRLLIEKQYNPSLLYTTIYLLPYIAGISIYWDIEGYTAIDILKYIAYSYFNAVSKTESLLGYLMFKALSLHDYMKSLGRLIEILRRTLVEDGIEVWVHERKEYYNGMSVNVVAIVV